MWSVEGNEFDKALKVALFMWNLRQDLLVNYQTNDGQNPKGSIFIQYGQGYKKINQSKVRLSLWISCEVSLTNELDYVLSLCSYVHNPLLRMKEIAKGVLCYAFRIEVWGVKMKHLNMSLITIVSFIDTSHRR